MLDTSDGSGGAALKLLDGPFMSGGGFPSLQGGNAGPAISSSDATSGGTNIFSNPFSVAGSGSTSSASSTPSTTATKKQSETINYLLMGVAGIAIIYAIRKK